ncbi:MAG: hypothetical protein C0475_00150 [Planctomyces sp.]|nr:hypothetical protein [Planctomyces sp.]MBA4038721.1 hypothetical protein [Planctomyces sp.]
MAQAAQTHRAVEMGVGRLRSWRRRAAVGAVALTLGAGGVGVWAWNGAGPAAGEGGGARVISDDAVARVTDFEVEVISTGVLAAAKQIEVKSELETEASLIELVAEGSVVKPGDVLARLNVEDLERRASDAERNLETARSEQAVADTQYDIQLNENESARRKAELAVDLAELELRKWEQGDVRSRRQSLAVTLDAAERNLSRLIESTEKMRGLVAEGFETRNRLQLEEIDLRKAKAEMETARLNLEVYEQFEHPRDLRKKESDLTEARAELARTLQRNDRQVAQVTARKQGAAQMVSLRSGELDRLQRQIESGVVRAPSGGLVIYGSTLQPRWNDNQAPLSVGKKVFRGELIAALPDTSSMVASVKVHESVAGRIRPGQRATVRIDAVGGQSVAAEVQSVGVLAESQGWINEQVREYTVKLALEPNGLALRPSMRCEAVITLERVGRALAVPIEAVFYEGPVSYVYLTGRGALARRPVKIARKSERLVEVVAGLGEGDRVLVRQPRPGEARVVPWEPEELAGVGLRLGDDGKIVAIDPPAAATPEPGIGGASAADAGQPGVVAQSDQKAQSTPPDPAAGGVGIQ